MYSAMSVSYGASKETFPLISTASPKQKLLKRL